MPDNETSEPRKQAVLQYVQSVYSGDCVALFSPILDVLEYVESVLAGRFTEYSLKKIGEVVTQFDQCNEIAIEEVQAAAVRTTARVRKVLFPPFDYQAYLLSSEWKTMRDARVEVDGGRCVVCSSHDRLNVHHRTYERIGNELQGDLITLCSDCHVIFHTNGRLAKPPGD